MSSLFFDRIDYQETGWIDDLSKSPIIGQELLEGRISDKYETEVPVKIGVIACMPKLEVCLNENGTPVYEYGPSKFKATVDYQALDLAKWRANFEKQAGVAVELECLVADTEARVKSDGLLFPRSKDIIGAKAKRVVSRIEKAFPENSRNRIKVGVRSEKFPVSDQIYRENFRRTFREIYEEIGLKVPREKLKFLEKVIFDFSDKITEYSVYRLKLRSSIDVALHKHEHQSYAWVTGKECYKRDDLMRGVHEILNRTGYTN